MTNLTNVQSIPYPSRLKPGAQLESLFLLSESGWPDQLGKLARQRYYLGTYMSYTVHKAKTRQGIGIGIDSLEPNVKDMITDIPLHVNVDFRFKGH
jgi:hypothetical protein